MRLKNQAIKKISLPVSVRKVYVKKPGNCSVFKAMLKLKRLQKIECFKAVV